MIIDTTAVEKFIKTTDQSMYQIAKETGISRTMLNRYRNGQVEFKGIKLENIEALQKYINDKKAENN